MSGIARGLFQDGVKTKKGAHWRQAQVSGFLRNPVYIGKVKYKDELFDGAHDPIVDPELWRDAQQLLEAMPVRPGRPPVEKRHLFTGGFLRCANCDDPMVPCARPNRNYEFYECSGRIHGCKTGAIRRRDIDEAVFSYFEQVALDVGATRDQLATAMSQKVGEATTMLAAAEEEAQDASNRLAKVKRDYTHGELTAAEWRELKADLEPESEAAKSQVKRLLGQVEAARSSAAIGDAEQAVIEQLARIRAAIAGDVNSAADLDALRALLRRLFDRFLFHPEPAAVAHVELIEERYWIEPVISKRAIEGYDDGIEPILSRKPLEQAVNNYAQGSGWL